MRMSSGMTLAGALASGCAMQAAARPAVAPVLLSDSLPGSRVFSRRPGIEISGEIDAALRGALVKSATLVTLL